MYLMYDSVDLDQIPASAPAVGCYRNGAYANEAEARRRWPHAHILPIATGGQVVCDCYDVENGDYRPAEVAGLWHLAHSRGVWRPCFYANLTTMPEVEDVLRNAGIGRLSFRLLVAHWTGKAEIPLNYDGCQFTDRALGRNLDESILTEGFFPSHPVTHPPVVWDSAEVQFSGGRWRIASMPYDAAPLGH